MHYEVMKVEPTEWKFSKPPVYTCPVCEQNEATMTVYYHIGERTHQIDTCHNCSLLDGDTLIARAMGG